MVSLAFISSICRLRAQCMISKSNVKFTDSEVRSKCLKINCDRCDNAFVVIFFKTMYNKTIIRFGSCYIRNNEGIS